MLKTNYICLRDCNDHLVFVTPQEFLKPFETQCVKIYGMGIDEISELQEQYLILNGKLPITVENIRELYKEKPCK